MEGERNIPAMMDIARVLRKPVNNPLPSVKVCGFCRSQVLNIIIDHRRPPITTYHSYPIGNLFQREKLLEGFGGFDMESRLGEGSEKRGITHNKVVKERGVRGVAERGMRGKRVV